MEVKANVQKRRQDRLRQLENRPRESENTPGGGAPPAPSFPSADFGPPLFHKGPLDGERWLDPEKAWKLREKELLRWYGDEDGTDPYRASDHGGEHGDERFPGSGFVPSRKQIWTKLAVSAALFAFVWAMFHLDSPWAMKGRRYVTGALTRDMDVQSAAAWYRDTFSGTPAFIPAFGSRKKDEAAKVTAAASRFVRPVKGKIVSPFSSRLQGVILETAPGANVASMGEGRIEFAGEREDTGYTLVIKHAGGFRTTYGYLQPAKWEPGDWVKAGDIIGSAGTGRNDRSQVYVAVMKDLRYMDPADVVAFD